MVNLLRALNRFNRTGEVIAQDATHLHHRATLAEHDEKYHGGMFKGGRCLFRKRGDELDSLGVGNRINTLRSHGKKSQTPAGMLRRAINRSELDVDVKKQMLSILKTFTNRDGTFKLGFLKSPNGADSNLKSLQWLFARTDVFRDGPFGDWLNLDRGERLKKAKAIYCKQTNETFDGPLKTLIEKAARWADGEGRRSFQTEVGKLEFDKKSVKDSLEHVPFTRAKYDAVFSIPHGFENAVYLGSYDDFDGNTITNHYFAYPVEYADKRCLVFCRARENADRSALYLHDIFIEADIKKIGPCFTPRHNGTQSRDCTWSLQRPTSDE